MQKLLRVQQVASIMSLQVSTVYELCRRGVLPHVRIAQGKRRALLRFREEDIEQLIRDRTIPVRGER